MCVKILMLSWEFPPRFTGGLGRHVGELSTALAEQGVEVHVLAPAPDSGARRLHPNLTVHWVDTAPADPRTNLYDYACQVNGLLDAAANTLWKTTGGFDLIHAHDWLVGLAAIELKLAHKCPLLATIHATEQGRWRNHGLSNHLSRQIDNVERNLTYEAWRVIACSHYMIGELGRLFALPLDKLDMIPNGINMRELPHFAPDLLAEFRAKYAPPKAPLIFSVGRLVFEKGFQNLVSAVPQVLESFPAAQFVMAGKGPLYEDLQQQARRLGVQEHVHFPGFISDTERDMFFSVADCAVFPSLYEPFGIVALEAMAFSCPVVAANVGGLAEVVRHDETGTLIYAGNPASVAWGILRVLSQPEKATAYAANAYQMAAEKYSWERVARRTLAVYERIIRERANTRW